MNDDSGTIIVAVGNRKFFQVMYTKLLLAPLVPRNVSYIHDLQLSTRHISIHSFIHLAIQKPCTVLSAAYTSIHTSTTNCHHDIFSSLFHYHAYLCAFVFLLLSWRYGVSLGIPSRATSLSYITEGLQQTSELISHTVSESFTVSLFTYPQWKLKIIKKNKHTGGTFKPEQ